MIPKKLTSLIFLLCITFTTYHIHASIILHGDSENPEQTFSFPIKAFVTNSDGSIVYFGADTEGANQFALTKFMANNINGMAVAPEKVSINKETVTNPFYNAAINKLAFMNKDNRIVATLKAYPFSVFAIDDIIKPDNIIMFALPVVDGSGSMATSNILALTAESLQFIFCAVSPFAGGNFGDPDSGIALLRRINMIEKTEENQDNNIMEPFFYQLDAEPGDPSHPNLHRAAALNGSTPAAYINTPATFLDNIVDLHYNNIFGLLYISLKIQGGSQPTDGARAIVIGKVEGQKTDNLLQQYKLTFKAIAPDTAFAADHNNIVGRITGSDTNPIISCYNVRTILTSTDLFYLVVRGGYGDDPETRQTFYTLPIVFKPGDDSHGMLAKKDAIPVDHYHDEPPYRLNYRAFEQEATTVDDLFTANDPAVQVGGGPLTSGEISNFFINSDAIFATVSSPSLGYLPGIFYSRALFDKYGRIKAWTAWQRVFGDINDPVFGGYIFQFDGSCTFLTGATDSQIFTLKRTIWQNDGSTAGMENLGKLIAQTFAPSQGGVRGFAEFASCSSGLDGISLVVATGVNKVMLAQTAYTPDSGILTPLAGPTIAQEPLAFTDGAIKVNFPTGNTNAISIEQGNLSIIGPIVTATIGTRSNDGLLFVGGVGGVAVLVDNDGNGWEVPPGLANQFEGLREGMTFAIIGNYHFVRKLLVDQGNLYVLCDDRLDRINLAACDFTQKNIPATTLATTSNLSVSSFLDCIISNQLALLGTTDGFFRSSAQQNVSSAPSITWQGITLPEGLASVLQLTAATATGCLDDLTSELGGNVFALSTDRGSNRSNLFRFAVTPTPDGIMIDELPDQFVKDQPSYFVEFSDFRNWILSDGGFLFHARDRENRERAALYIAPSALRTGARFAGNNNTVIYTNTTTQHYVPMMRNSATGSLLLPNNNGLVCNE